MLSRSFSSAVSLLRASESKVLTAPMRSLYTMNHGRALRPVACVVSRRMSNQEASSTEGKNVTNATISPEIKRLQVLTDTLNRRAKIASPNQ